MYKTNIKAVYQGKIPKDVPFWLMRQAGRYLPEYKALRAQAGSFMNLCFTPEWAAEVTLQPVVRFDMDAAILFSDILVLPHALGQTVQFVENEGPQLAPLDIQALDISQLPEKISPILETVRLTRQKLSENKSLIGFAGAPFTVACYMIDGKGGGFPLMQKHSRENTAFVSQLIDIITDATIDYLSAQIKAGADIVKIFDSWAGLIPENRFEDWAIRPAKRIYQALSKAYPDTPLIGFPRGACLKALDYAEQSGISAIAIDQDFDIEKACRLFDRKTVLQGNLSPDLLLKGGDAMKKEAERILQATQDRPFVFNLGHGIIKETPPQHVADLANIIRTFRS